MSEVKLSDLNSEFRIDSEYFKKEILNYENKLTNYKLLTEVSNFLIGPFGSTVTTDKYVNNSRNFYIRGLDIGNFFLKEPEAKIDNKLFSNLNNFHVKYKDIFVTVVGTLGKVSIITEKNINAIFSCKSTIIRNTKVNPYYLTTFLNTNIGYKLLLRGKRGAIQEGLNLYDLKEIKIPLVSNTFQLQIESLVKLAYQKLGDSKTLYKEAEEILLKELDLLNFEPSRESVSIKSFSESFGSSERFDAEYYQPKYDEIEEKIKKVNFDKLDKLVNIKKSVETGSEAYQNKGIEYIRVSNLDIFEISKSDIFIPNDYFNKEEDLKKLQPQKDTILLSKDGSVGIAYKVKKDEKFITSGAILHLKVKDNRILADYLTLVLNSIIVKLQAERDAGGSIIQHWKPSEIKEVLIPIIDKNIQTQISNKIQTSFNLREESKSLLETAKRAVEIAIEENEAEAIKFVEEIRS